MIMSASYCLRICFQHHCSRQELLRFFVDWTLSGAFVNCAEEEELQSLEDFRHK
jgi:hypothetical protein